MVLPSIQPAEDRHARDRAIMVARHLEARGIVDPLVLAAMGEVPREAFLPDSLAEFAYEDSALPIEAGQTISQPYIVARMIELLELQPPTRCSRSAPARATPPRCSAASPARSMPSSATRSWPIRRARGSSARLRQCRDHFCRRHQGLARSRSVRRHPRLGRRPESAGGAQAATRHRRTAGDPGRPRRAIRRCCSSAVSARTSSRRRITAPSPSCR